MTFYTDQQLLTEIQNLLLEDPDGGATWISGLWTPAEVLGYLNQRQNSFIRETSLLISIANITSVPQTGRVELPDDWVATQRLTWFPHVGRPRELAPANMFEGDLAYYGWPSNPEKPRLFDESTVPTRQIQLIPAPANPCTLQLMYVALADVLDGSGVQFIVPPDYVSFIKWGVLADMLGKIGRAHDPERALYCAGRYQEGVEAAKTLLKGW